MARVKVVLNRRGVRALLNDEGVGRFLEARMRPVLQAAIDAPDVTGDYEASLDIQRAHTDRVVARVTSSDPAAVAIEARRGTLARALDRARGI